MEQKNIYDPKEFKNILDKRIGEKKVKCPFCGGERFTTTDHLAAIMISQDKSNISLGPCIPAGMLICTNCGHIDFFSLGVLGLLNKDKQNDDSEKG